MKSSVQQGTSGQFILDLEPDPTEDIDAGLFYLDQDTGEFFERQPIDGDDADDGTWTSRGRVAPFVGDQSPPAAVAGLTVTPVTVQNEDGTVVPGFEVSWTANTEDDLIGYVLQVDLTGTSWATPLARNIGLATTVLVREGLIAGATYDFRIAARDAEGYQSTWSSTVTGTAASDSIAPDIPGAPQVVAGFKMLGVTWEAAAESPDFAFFQARWYLTSAGVAEASVVRTKSNHIILEGLTADAEYTVQVRAVDLSGNVATSATDNTGVNFEENSDTGWSDASTGTPSLVGVADLAVSQLIANFITSGEVSADILTSGDVNVGGTGNPGSIEVFDSFGRTIVVIDEDGLVMVNPDDVDQAMHLHAGSIRFTKEWTGVVATTTWTTAITPEGINASAITFGQGAGGANAVPNAGFELAVFTAVTNKQWTLAADWATATSKVNLDTSGNALTMTAV